MGAIPNGGEGGVPFGEIFAETEISIEQRAARPQHAGDFGEETGKARITMRRLDVEHGIEGRIGKWQLFGVAHDVRHERVFNRRSDARKARTIRHGGGKVEQRTQTPQAIGIAPDDGLLY